MIVCPASDPGFAKHPVHGVAGQRASFLAAMSLCPQQRTAIDVGAHIGLWTGMLGNVFDTVFAYEPVSENYDCLLENTASFDNVLPQRAAIGGYVGWCSLMLPPDTNSGCWYLLDDAYGEAPIITIDSLNVRDVDLIKIDVEGAEGMVIRGAFHTLQRERPVIVFEDNGLGSKHFGNKWIDPKPLLIGLGYHCARRVRKDEVWIPC